MVTANLLIKVAIMNIIIAQASVLGPTNEVRYGDLTTWCDIQYDSIDTDYINDLYLAGRTVSIMQIHDKASYPSNGCTWGRQIDNQYSNDGSDYVGYVVKFTSGTKIWEKFFYGNNDSCHCIWR